MWPILNNNSWAWFRRQLFGFDVGMHVNLRSLVQFSCATLIHKHEYIGHECTPSSFIRAFKLAYQVEMGRSHQKRHLVSLEVSLSCSQNIIERRCSRGHINGGHLPFYPELADLRCLLKFNSFTWHSCKKQQI